MSARAGTISHDLKTDWSDVSNPNGVWTYREVPGTTAQYRDTLMPPADQGHVSFTVLPNPNLPTGTELRNVALIKFDVNAIIATNQIDPQDPSAGTSPDREALNTIDAGRPTSSVVELPAVINTPQFTVSWSGEDNVGGSGIATFDIYVSVDHGPFSLWLSDTPATSATFTGESGRRYAFYADYRSPPNFQNSTPTAEGGTADLAGKSRGVLGGNFAS